MLLRDLSSDVIPHFELKLLTDSHHLLLIGFELLNVDHQAAMLIHVFDALVIFEVPNLDVALAESNQYISPGYSVDRRDLVPVALVDYAELAFGNIDEIHVHVFGAQEQVLLVLSQLDALDIFC